MIFAQGSRFGGHALFVKDGKLYYVYNFLGIPPEQRLVADAPLRGTAHRRRRVHQGADGRAPRVASAPLKLYIDDKVVAEAEIRTRRRTTRSAARACASATTAATPVSVEYNRGSSSPAADRQGRLRRRRRRLGCKLPVGALLATAGPERDAVVRPPDHASTS